MGFFDPVVETWDRAQWWVRRRIPDPVANSWERFAWRVRQVGRAVQKVVVTFLLFFLYLLGVGATRLLVSLFYRRYLSLNDDGPGQASYWKDATGYDPTPENLLRQI